MFSQDWGLWKTHNSGFWSICIETCVAHVICNYFPLNLSNDTLGVSSLQTISSHLVGSVAESIVWILVKRLVELFIIVAHGFIISFSLRIRSDNTPEKAKLFICIIQLVLIEITLEEVSILWCIWGGSKLTLYLSLVFRQISVIFILLLWTLVTLINEQIFFIALGIELAQQVLGSSHTCADGTK